MNPKIYNILTNNNIGIHQPSQPQYDNELEEGLRQLELAAFGCVTQNESGFASQEFDCYKANITVPAGQAEVQQTKNSIIESRRAVKTVEDIWVPGEGPKNVDQSDKNKRCRRSAPVASASPYWLPKANEGETRIWKFGGRIVATLRSLFRHLSGGNLKRDWQNAAIKNG